MRDRADCSIVRGWKNENCLARFCLFEAVSVDGGGDARVRRSQHANGDRVSGGDEVHHRRRDRGAAAESPRVNPPTRKTAALPSVFSVRRSFPL
jgi:hypothetical protein